MLVELAVGDYSLLLESAVPPEVQHLKLRLSEYTANEESPVAIHRILFATHHGDPVSRCPFGQPLDPLEEARRRRKPLVAYVPVVVVELC